MVVGLLRLKIPPFGPLKKTVTPPPPPLTTPKNPGPPKQTAPLPVINDSSLNLKAGFSVM